MLSKKFLDRIKGDSRGRTITWVALIAVGLVIALVLGVVGCSGSHKLNPTDPVASKQKQQNPLGETGTTGTLTDTGDSGRSIGTSGPGSGDEAMLGLMQQLVRSGGGQGGRIFRGTVYAGVFDAETQQPIADAIVCIGDGDTGDAGASTGDEGYVEMSYPIDNPSDPNGVTDNLDFYKLYITAGAEGYELMSYSYVTNEIVVFMLEPQSRPETANIEGTFTFPDDSFLANVYATNAVDYVDGVLQPSAPGDNDDTFNLTVRTGKEVFFTCVVRDPATGSVLKILPKTVGILTSGEIEIIDETLPNPSEPGLMVDISNDEWIDYPPSSEFVGDVLFPPTYFDTVENIFIYQRLYDVKYGLLPMDDVVEWLDAGIPGDLRSFRTTYKPSLLKILPFDLITLWIDVQYNDGSGTYTLFNTSFVLNGFSSYTLSLPPMIAKPSNDDLGVGLNPDIAWTLSDGSLSSGGIVIVLDDTENGNKWRIFTKDGESETTLPTLSDKMEDWGLTVGNQVSMVIESDLLSSEVATGEDGLVTYVTGNSPFRSFNYSGTVSFTP